MTKMMVSAGRVKISKAVKMTIWFAVFGSVCTVARTAETKSFDVVSIIKNRFAETTISSEVLNDADTSEEVDFHVMLPKEAFITYFAMTINGTTYEGEIEEKEQAEKIYEKAKEKGRTTGIVRTEDESDKIFKTSVNVGSKTAVQFKLVYQQILRKLRGKFKHTVILLSTTIDENVSPSVNIYICESQDILSIKADKPPDGSEYSYDVTIQKERNSANIKYFNFESSLPEAINTTDDYSYDDYSSSYEGNFSYSYSSSLKCTVQYELEKSGQDGGDIVVSNGYVTHFFAPDIEIPARRMVFVLDISGSMVGMKLAQQRTAMMKIVDKLTHKDRFGIIKFDDSINLWSDGKIHPAEEEYVESAKNFMMYPHENGGTHIWIALEKALNMLIEDAGDEEVMPQNNFIVLLTDGQGVLSAVEILENINRLNKKRFAINTIGFGFGVDADLLKAVAANNHGSWLQIIEDLNAELQIEDYMDELGIEILSGLQIDYPAFIEETIQPENEYFYGAELITVGRLKEGVERRKKKGPYAVRVRDESRKIVAKAEFNLDQKESECTNLDEGKVKDFGVKAFGMMKAQSVLRSYDAELNDTKKQELKEQAIKLSVLYKLVTSVTSMLVIKPDDRLEVERELAEDEFDVVSTPAPSLAGSGGFTGYHFVTSGWYAYGDPHFMVRLSEEVNVCFNWPKKGNRVINLFHDIDNSLIINAYLEEKFDEVNQISGVYIEQLGFLLEHGEITILMDQDEIVLMDFSENNQNKLQVPISNTGNSSYSYKSLTFDVQKFGKNGTRVTMELSDSVTFRIYVQRRAGSRTHLDLQFGDSTSFSNNLDGLLGRFHEIKGKECDLKIRENKNLLFKEAMPYVLTYNAHRVPVRKEERRVTLTEDKIDCYFVRQLENLIGVSFDSFELPALLAIPHTGDDDMVVLDRKRGYEKVDPELGHV